MSFVANPPCGVETCSPTIEKYSLYSVANPPCGVETLRAITDLEGLLWGC